MTQIIGLANDDGLVNYNPSAHLLSNGSVALMAHTNYIYPGHSGLVIAIAKSWEGPYYVTVPDRSITTCSQCLEDPFLVSRAQANSQMQPLSHKM